MHNEDKAFQIPYGTRDYLPEEAAAKRKIETLMANMFAAWGYDEIVTPTIEYLDTLLMGNGHVLEPHMFKFFDKDNRTLALRHEMTTPIARVVASRLKDEVLPVKLSYISSVYRYEQTQTGRQCEFNQAGVEFMGADSAMADSEIIALAVKSMEAAGLENFQVCLGQVDFINGIMEEFYLSSESQQKLKTALEQHDLVGLGNIADTLDITSAGKALLKEIPLLHGSREVIVKAKDAVKNEKSKAAIDNLLAIYERLEQYGVAEHVQFDLDVIRDFNYYTGMVFEIYTPGLGFPICGGGRYDRMLEDFGTNCPATGFASGIERIMLALEQQEQPASALRKDVFVAYSAGNEAEAIKKAAECRASGLIVSLAPQPQTEAEAALYQNNKGYKDLVYLK